MARIFACVSQNGLRLNIFDGATGEVISDHALPDNLLGQAQVDVSFDGRYIAVLAGNKDYVWFHDRQAGTSGTVTLSGTIGGGRGFDGENNYYVGGYQQYRKISPPFTASTLINTPGVAYTLYPAPVAEKAIVLERNPNTGETRFIRFDLSTGNPGEQIGNPGEQGPAATDADAANAFTGVSTYGVTQWDYDSGSYVQTIGPASGAVATSFRFGLGFTDDGSKFVLKANDNALGVGSIGGGGITQVSLDPVLQYSADNAYTVMEGMVSNEIAVLSSASQRQMLVGFNVVTGQVVWHNTLGSNTWNTAGDPRSLGVQGVAAGYVPPEPAGFWKDLLLAYETT